MLGRKPNLAPWGSGGAVSLQAGPEQSPGGVLGGEVPRKFHDLHSKKAQKWSVYSSNFILKIYHTFIL